MITCGFVGWDLVLGGVVFVAWCLCWLVIAFVACAWIDVVGYGLLYFYLYLLFVGSV